MAQGMITARGREKLCKAHAGEAALPKIVKMAFGSGGVDADGRVLDTTGEEEALREELMQKEIDGYTFPVATTARYSVRLAKQELAGENISEQGLFDEDGDLVAYKTFLPKGKDDDMEFLFDMDEIF